MNKIHSAIACNLDANIIAASMPLFTEERVEAVEWSFDTLFKVKEVPQWFEDLLQAFSKERRLIGHGVFFSLFSGKWLPQQQAWLEQLKQLCTRYNFEHITEHFGFMTGSDFHHGAPLSIPYNKSTLTIGRDRLMRIQDACRCPVGLENLAFSYSLDEVKKHGEFLSELITPVNGFIILDLHNLYCQLHNFSLPFETLINLYPLDRVREIHISGGSWEPHIDAPEEQVRRDTHDGGVPDEVFSLLQYIIPKCPNLQYVVMEQLGNCLQTETDKKLFYKDFLRMQDIVDIANQANVISELNSFLPLSPNILANSIVEDTDLYKQQLVLSDILETAPSYEISVQKLQNSILARTDWNIETWSPYMLETARAIAWKWKKGD